MSCKYGLIHMGTARLKPCSSGFIYVARHDDLCKIGCTTESHRSGVKARLAALKRKTGQPFELVNVLYFSGCIKGLELAIHKMFARYRIGTDEIFSDADTVIEHVQYLKQFTGTKIEQLGASDYEKKVTEVRP